MTIFTCNFADNETKRIAALDPSSRMAALDQSSRMAALDPSSRVFYHFARKVEVS